MGDNKDGHVKDFRYALKYLSETKSYGQCLLEREFSKTANTDTYTRTAPIRRAVH